MMRSFEIGVFWSRGLSNEEDVGRMPMASALTKDGRTMPVALTVNEYEVLRAVLNRCCRKASGNFTPVVVCTEDKS
jgi:hypothetical protein